MRAGLLPVLAAAQFRAATGASCDPVTAEGGTPGLPAATQFSIVCPASDPPPQIKIIKANYGGNCNEQCKCGPSSGCMPCCMHGGPCCPTCLEPKGNDFNFCIYLSLSKNYYSRLSDAVWYSPNHSRLR